MANYKLEDFTYGLELEWSDVDIRVQLPEAASWSKKEWLIVNSDGTANDPTGKRTHLGGEINTVPSSTVEGQVQLVDELQRLLNPKALYRGSVHVHIGVPGLVEDIEGLVKLFQYTQDNQDFVYFEVLPRELIDYSQYTDKKDIKLAKQFDRQKNLWGKKGVPAHRVPDILNAKTPKEFYDAHFFLNEKTGKRLYHMGIYRAGINVRSLFSHGTIEFRVFPCTTDPKVVEDYFEFSRQFILAGLTDHSRTAKDIFESREWNFAPWPTFDVELEKGFHATKQRPNI